MRERPGTETRVIKLTGFVGLDSLDGNDNFDYKQLMPGTIVQVTPEKNVLNGLFVSVNNGILRNLNLFPNFLRSKSIHP